MLLILVYLLGCTCVWWLGIKLWSVILHPYLHAHYILLELRIKRSGNKMNFVRPWIWIFLKKGDLLIFFSFALHSFSLSSSIRLQSVNDFFFQLLRLWVKEKCRNYMWNCNICEFNEEGKKRKKEIKNWEEVRISYALFYFKVIHVWMEYVNRIRIKIVHEYDVTGNVNCLFLFNDM